MNFPNLEKLGKYRCSLVKLILIIIKLLICIVVIVKVIIFRKNGVF